MEKSAEIHVLGCAAVVVSAVNLEDWKLIERHEPESLAVRDDSGHPIFQVRTNCGPGLLTKDYAIFGSPTTEDGKATITILLDPDSDDKTGMIQDALTNPLMKLIKMEGEIPEIMDNLLKKTKEAGSHIIRH